MAKYDFFGRRPLHWLLLLPLAMPAYIIAYCYTGLLDVAGPVQSGLRQGLALAYGDYWFPDVRSLPGAIMMLSLVLYPYVYLLAYNAFKEQGQQLEEASRLLGVKGLAYFRTLALPLARPAIVAGVALAMMEALADFGTVEYFGVSTFTTGIYRTWFAMGNGLAAAQLASVLCTLVFVILLLEKKARRQMAFYQKHHKVAPRKQSTKGIWLLLFCLLWPFLGFLLPAITMSLWVWELGLVQFDASYWQLMRNSLLLALAAALLLVAVAVLLAYAKRIVAKGYLDHLINFAAMGYAIPGTVIAVGLLLPLGGLDRGINLLSQEWFNYRPGLVLSGTLFALLLAYLVRFLTLSLHQVDAGLMRIKPSLDQAARSLGCSAGQNLRRVHLPMLKGSLLSALVLAFVEVLKELPATLILRPFNFNTLAVRAYELASEERLHETAFPALAIVLVGLIPIILLTRLQDTD